MTRRPAGVVFAAIVLGCAAFLLVIMAGFSAVFAMLAGHIPAAALGQPGVARPPRGLMMAITAATGIFYLALAAWAIATVAGLVRMRPWARTSVMIIGGGLAAFGLVSAAASAAIPLLVRSMPLPPGPSPAALHVVFLLIALLWLAVAAVGIWWLVYFALRPTREAFALAQAQRHLLSPRIPLPRTTPPPGLLDFSVAQPARPAEFPAEPQTPYELQQPTVQTSATAPQWAQPARPVSITILAVLLLAGAATGLMAAAMPFPLFVFGLALTGWPAHITMLVYAGLTASAGIGLFRLRKSLWVLAFVLFSLGLANTAAMFLPSVRGRLIAYSQSLSSRLSMGYPTPALDPAFMTVMLLISAIFSVLLFSFILVLLWRARWAFEPHMPKPHTPEPRTTHAA